jgi:hypothetical protein
VDKLSESEWVSLATDVAEAVYEFSFELSGIHREAVTRPLYAILLGVWVRDTSIDRPNTPAALRHLVDKWLERPKSDSGLQMHSITCQTVSEAGDMESGGTGRGRARLTVLLKLG